MAPTLALLHTTAVTVPALGAMAREELPGVRAVNLLDDSLLPDVIAAGEVTAAVRGRLRAYVEQAAALGAAAVMSCCSSIGEAMEEIGRTAPLPVWRIDEAMAEEAAGAGRRIGVLATVSTTLGPTARLVERACERAGRGAEVDARVVDGAFAALGAGDGERHDRLVRAALEAMLERADVVVLAQASMARIASALPPQPVPILTSPASGLRRAGARLAAQESAA